MSTATPTSSRFSRPANPTPVELTARDRALLVSVAHHRFLSAEHLWRLHFLPSSLNAAQTRLRRLWEHEFLERYWPAHPWQAGRAHPSRRPLYVLGRTGVAIVAGELGRAVTDVRRAIPDVTTHHVTLAHELVTADFVASLTAALRGSGEASLVSAEPESDLWRRLRQRGSLKGLRGQYLVSDTAVTLGDAAGERSFHLEVVRADVRGGNRSLLTKMQLYLHLLRAGYFRETFGHQRLRAVLFLTTSAERAENLRELARRLDHGAQLFWFGAFEQWDRGGTPESSLTPDTVLTPMWTDVSGEKKSLLS